MKTFKAMVPKDGSPILGLFEILTRISSLDHQKLTEASLKGALWIQKRGKGKILKLRSLTAHLDPGDLITLYYDPKVLAYPELNEAEALYEDRHYGVWLKKAGVMPQGTQAADHTSLLRYIEKKTKLEVHLVHRLDRETEGLMIFAYSSDAAAKLGDLFQKNLIKKTYEAVVLGEMEKGFKGTINASLDDKKAITHYQVLASGEGKCLLEVQLETGRLHQIRRHLDSIGHPVIGDPLYGRGNKNREGLKLLAKGLEFDDPWTKKRVNYTLSSGLLL